MKKYDVYKMDNNLLEQLNENSEKLSAANDTKDAIIFDSSIALRYKSDNN